MMARFRNLSNEERALAKTLPGPKAKPIEAPGKFVAPEPPALPAEVPAPKIPEPHRVPEPPRAKEAPEPPAIAQPKPLKVEPPVQAFEMRLKKLERLAGDPTGTWRLWRKGLRMLAGNVKIREWIASEAREGDPDYVRPNDRMKLRPEQKQKILRDAVNEYRYLEKSGQTSLKDYLNGKITREGLRQRTQALFPETPPDFIEKYLDTVDKGAGVMKQPKYYQPPPNTPEATAWHNEAMKLAKERLGYDAPIGKLLQEAARIQQRGKPVQ
jgi:hypothetical protein